jgi:hypothetical protein
MTVQFSDPVRNARADAIESTIGPSAILKLRTGAQPANCAAADSGTVCATINLPSDWMGGASGGVKSKLGTWQDLLADAAGTIAHFRFYDSGGTVCGAQGSVTLTGGGGDMTLDNTNVQPNQAITITSFSETEGNA